MVSAPWRSSASRRLIGPQCCLRLRSPTALTMAWNTGAYLDRNWYWAPPPEPKLPRSDDLSVTPSLNWSRKPQGLSQYSGRRGGRVEEQLRMFQEVCRNDASAVSAEVLVAD